MIFVSESGVEYVPPSQSVLPLLNKPDASPSAMASSTLNLPYANGSSNVMTRTRSLGAKPDNFDQLAARAMTYESLKDQRRKELLRLEGELLDSNQKQMELLEMMSANRRDLLRMMAKVSEFC